MNNFFEAIPAEIIARSQEVDVTIESNNCASAVEQALNKTVLDGGKRLRPLLTYLVGRLFNDDLESLDVFAASIEKVHAASLAHDDVIDDATQRRGNPSINIVTTNKKAVLAGDYLLADVIYKLTHTGNLEAVKFMSEVIKDLALGEWVQSDAIEHREYTRELIEKIAHYKTASVMSYCSWIGAQVYGASDEIKEAAKELGRRVGIAFQLMDDTLDFASSSQKDFNLDIKNDLVNSVILEWLLDHPQAFSEYKNGSSLESVFDSSNIDKYVQVIQQKAEAHINVANDMLLKVTEYASENGVSDIDKKAHSLKFIMDYILRRDV